MVFYGPIAWKYCRYLPLVLLAASHNVIACNAVAEIMAPPAFYQTAWFEALCGGCLFGILWLLYLLRVRQISTQMQERLEAQHAERERVTRELHDTLQRCFHDLILHLQVVDDLLPPGAAKEKLAQSLERADQAIAEARSAIQNLRSSTTSCNELAEAIQSTADELIGDGSATFRLVVEGTARDLDPIRREELQRIACEALRNSCSHARARQIEAEITYSERLFRLRIRDDGCGIPPDILESGRCGHYGLSGMRERARQIGAKLDIWSGPGTGTEIDLAIEGSVIYCNPPQRSHMQVFRALRRRAGGTN